MSNEIKIQTSKQMYQSILTSSPTKRNGKNLRQKTLSRNHIHNLSIQDDYNTIISTFLQLFSTTPCTAPFRHSFTHLPAISPDHLKPIQISMKQMPKLDFLHLHLSTRDCKVSLQHHVGFHLSIVSLNKSKQIYLF